MRQNIVWHPGGGLRSAEKRRRHDRRCGGLPVRLFGEPSMPGTVVRELTAQKNCTAAQIAMALLYHQPLNTFAAAAMSPPDRIAENIGALSVELASAECRYLNLE